MFLSYVFIFWVTQNNGFWCALGKTEFSPKEDAHVIADCVKVFLFPAAIKFWFLWITNFTSNLYVSLLNVLAIWQYFLRELPSSPVPTSCCNALLEACRKFVPGLCVLLYSSIPVLPYTIVTKFILNWTSALNIVLMPNHYVSYKIHHSQSLHPITQLAPQIVFPLPCLQSFWKLKRYRAVACLLN